MGKRLSLISGLQFTSYSGQRTIGSIRLNELTTGLNLFLNVNYPLISNAKHNVSVSAGPVFRLQNSSVPSKFEYNLSPTGAELYTLQFEKSRSASIGYLGAASYSYKFNSRVFLGVKFMLQNDTKADLILSQALYIGLQL
jgi:hypothetical protein